MYVQGVDRKGIKLNLILLRSQMFLLLNLSGILQELQQVRTARFIKQTAQIQYVKLNSRLE